MRLGGSVPLLSAQCIFCQLAECVDLSKNILLFVVHSDITEGIASERPKPLTAMKTIIVSHLSRVCNEHLLLTKVGTPSWLNESA